VVYELQIGWKTIRKEGLGSLLTKIGMYLAQILRASRFLVSHPAIPQSADAAVDYAQNIGQGLFEPGQVRSEILELTRIIGKLRPRTVLEIGTANGGTLLLWCQLADPEGTIISVDLPGGVHGGGYPFWRNFLYQSFAQKRQRLRLLRRDSHAPDSQALVRALVAERGVDFLFIDGDHTYEGVRMDFEGYAPLVNRGGVIAFHDICIHPPEMRCEGNRLWEEIKGRYRHLEIIENRHQGWAGIGVLFVEK
jgi:cephalosporin hydroxylase